jgi:sigma-54 dependent transcriptional regulator, acetoin dehydrogenase operon transcriptional activator AcoR
MGQTFDDSDMPRPARRVVYAPYLVVALECDRPLAGSARFALEGVDVITIGRGDIRCAERTSEKRRRLLHLRVPGRSMSAIHARLLRTGSAWAIEDLGSRNGTFVNGQRVPCAVLGSNDVFELGHTLFRIHPTLATLADAPPDVDFGSCPLDVASTLHPTLAEQFAMLATLAPSQVPLLIVGESGTGKEVVARWVHVRTGGSGSFVGVNCGAIPAALVESQLFGHVKGAFSGAIRDEPGFVRAAQGGTLFLDEIGDLPKASQAALLRVLQEREVVPVGATRPIPVDIRLVAATHQPLEEMITKGDFRRDLFARIAGAVITLAPLRERRDDVGILVAALLAKVASQRASAIALTPEAGRALLSHTWPLNVRELEQCLTTCVTLAKHGVVDPSHLPPKVAQSLEEPTAPVEHAVALSERDQGLRLELLHQLSQHQGNLADVARAMGKARMQIHRWCKRFGIDPNAFRR